jgi:hypothetical protein
LSGRVPFAGPSPMDTAMMHVNRPMPSLHALCSDIPFALESVVNQALGRVPSQRFQRASELVEAFTQVCQGTQNSTRRAVGKDVSSFVEEVSASSNNFLLDQQADERGTGSWQLMPPVVTGKTPPNFWRRTRPRKRPAPVPGSSCRPLSPASSRLSSPRRRSERSHWCGAHRLHLRQRRSRRGRCSRRGRRSRFPTRSPSRAYPRSRNSRCHQHSRRLNRILSSALSLPPTGRNI